jgi:hypothetical protein
MSDDANENAAQENQPESGQTEWWAGFENYKEKLECLSCAATVRHSRESARKHLEWHAGLNEALDRH